jgi:hypothetical protein
MNTPPQGLVEASPDSPKPGTDAMSHAGYERLRHNLDCYERPSHDDELDEEISSRVDELRKKSGEEQKTLRIGERRERPLPEQRPACSWFG